MSDEEYHRIMDDDDSEDVDDDVTPDPDYYYCYSCGYSCSPKTYRRIGSECPRCTAELSEEFY